MPQTWQYALSAYRYPVELALFEDAADHPGWFRHDTGKGGCEETVEFENRFRRFGPDDLEAWYEVVFWKLFSQPNHRQRHTRSVIRRLSGETTASELWELTQKYVERPCRTRFKELRRKFFTSDVVATVATFPAFVCPEKFPMVDNHAAKWAYANGSTHGYNSVGGPTIVAVPEIGPGQTVVKGSDWRFVSSWTAWCQFTAELLSKATAVRWRARDVEMAIFTADRMGLPLNSLVQFVDKQGSSNVS